MARFIYPASGGGSASADIADFIFINEDEDVSKITLPINKEMTIETTRDDGGDADINIRAADDVFITAQGDDINLDAFSEVGISTGDGNYEWNFTNTGCIRLPSFGQICNIPNSSGDGYGYSTISITPDVNTDDNRYIIIDPTAPNHIHIRAGGTQDASSAQLFLGGEQANVSIWDGAHEVYVQSYNSESDSYYNWTFGNTGTLYGPAMGGLIVTALQGAGEDYPLGINSNDKILLTGTNGEFLNDADVPSNQIATIGDVDTATDKAYISLSSSADQGPFTADAIQAFTYTDVDFSNDITLTDGSKINFAKAGKYNIAFSAQMHQTNSSGIVQIWLRKNGNNVPSTNTKFSITANNPYYVAAWNFFVDVADDDFIELIWSSSDNNTVVEYEPATGSGPTAKPAIPSIILTVNQVD